MVKSMNSQQVENENTNRISQQVESDATPSSPDSLVLLKITLNVIEGDDHVADEDAYDDEDQGPVMDDVQDSAAVERARRNPRKPSWLTINMIIAYALSVIEEAIPSIYQSLRCERMP